MKKLTIFTPTYNRKEKLTQLYDSLKSQTDQSFQWMIVDDGSTDGTAESAAQWCAGKELDIVCYFQEHQGKCAALKRGLALCETPWFLCVDSDDTLRPEAVARMLEDMEEPAPGWCIGYIYPRQLDGCADRKWIPADIRAISIMDAKHLYGIKETAILFQTEYLKKIDIPRFEGETFLSEEVLYIQLAKYGRFIPRSERFYIAQYRQDGITNNLFKHWLANPRGTLLLLNARYQYCGSYPLGIRARERIKCILNLNAFCMARGLRISENTPSRVLSALFYIPARIWRRIRFS